MATNSMFRMAGIGIAAAIGFVFALTWLGNTFPRPPVMDDPRVFDDDGNEWYYFSDGYIYFFNGTERAYYWFDASASLVYIEYHSGIWWGPDTSAHL